MLKDLDKQIFDIKTSSCTVQTGLLKTHTKNKFSTNNITYGDIVIMVPAWKIQIKHIKVFRLATSQDRSAVKKFRIYYTKVDI